MTPRPHRSETLPITWMLLAIFTVVCLVLASGAGGLVHDISHALGGTR